MRNSVGLMLVWGVAAVGTGCDADDGGGDEHAKQGSATAVSGERTAAGGECVETEACGGGETTTPLLLSFDGAAAPFVAAPASVFDNELTGERLSTASSARPERSRRAA